jgi:glycosyltransferase involved in cell wall biosynthesis
MTKTTALFLVWGTPDQGPRSRALARELGIPVHFIRASLPRGAVSALVRYPLQALSTLRLFARERPRVIFVQNPPPLAALCAWLYGRLRGASYVIDAHSAAFSPRALVSGPGWLKKLLARGAEFTIVTNEHWQERVRAWGGRAIILRDIPTTFPGGADYPLDGGFNIAFINTFSEDEPLETFLQAAAGLPGVTFHVTGKVRAKDAALVAGAPPNVRFTGFLPDETYYALLRSVNVVMCLTTRDHTMQRGACEALSLGKPIVTSDWSLLRQYFHKGTVHVDNSVAGIRQGVMEMQAQHHAYQTGIIALRSDQDSEWRQNVQPLHALIAQGASQASS